MLEGMRKRMEALQVQMGSLAIAKEPFDPSTLNDTIATKTEWTPSKRGGANFRTYRLVQVDPSRHEFRATVAAKLVFGSFGLVGVVQIVLATWFITQGGDSPDADLGTGGMGNVALGVIFMLSGLAMIAGTLLLFRFLLPPVVFDKRRGECWKGGSPPTGAAMVRIPTERRLVKIADVHALQLLRGSHAFELNLVFADASRWSVIHHSDGTMLLSDAERLATFLGKPLWDAVG